MNLHLDVEDMEPGNWVAWVFEFPGCYSRATTREEAIKAIPNTVEELFARLSKLGLVEFEISPPFEIVIAEEFRSFNSSPDYLVNAFFENDRIPLSEKDIEYARSLLGLNRHELLSIISELPAAILDRQIAGEVQQNIRGIVRHIATAEWWYWDRFSMAFPRSERPDDLFELLEKIRNYTLQRLPELIGSTQTEVRSGEEWSPRKLLRRAIWHERVHTLQIVRYLRNIME